MRPLLGAQRLGGLERAGGDKTGGIGHRHVAVTIVAGVPGVE